MIITSTLSLESRETDNYSAMERRIERALYAFFDGSVLAQTAWT